MAQMLENNDSYQVALNHGKEKGQKKAKTTGKENLKACACREG